MNNVPEPDDHQVVLDALTSASSVASIRDALDRIARQSSDRELKIYLAPVRSVLASATVQNMSDSAKIALPVDEVPYSSLIAYCRRKVR